MNPSLSRATLAAALAAILLAACASMDADYTAARESWRGATYEEVLAAWGGPARSDKAGSQDTFTWFSEGTAAPRGGSSVGVGVGTTRGGGGGSVGIGVGVGSVLFPAGPESQAVRCDRTLVFSQGRVVGENWAGDPEFCKRFARRK